jgi:phosphate starvation-inducible PhoH-like protein
MSNHPLNNSTSKQTELVIDMHKVITTKELHLSKRKNRALAQPEFQTQSRSNTYNRHNATQTNTNNTIDIDNYRPQRQRPINLTPKSRAQEDYIDDLQNPDKHVVFATGPAGTGKTMIAVLAALQAFRDGTCKKIIITRPAVGVDDEKHGFLPGDLNAKMEPWTKPIMDYVLEYYRPIEVTKMLEEQQIELAPLAFMRGRTFKNAWIIFDEAQNSSINQMKMILTRLGENSKMVVTGDLNQTDNQFARDNGLLDFIDKITEDGSDIFGYTKFAAKDAQRSIAMKEVLRLYGEN